MNLLLYLSYYGEDKAIPIWSNILLSKVAMFMEINFTYGIDGNMKDVFIFF